ncbi:MAG: acetyl-CoA synthetase [Candidatus Solincola sediminis]|uniref:Acetyl-CoA synthetase n=1 Tax=Candidatus Solincola sediminis TaxID=1797199 RepID=A0A1F2WM12_9ACTN|nr:MAG: acetyl-CoA synthetase [Candidatus Solincola sediminis]OFW58371.1 MAG: acetyl-CoA synthetase [Candidatus Solincola sediminis]
MSASSGNHTKSAAGLVPPHVKGFLQAGYDDFEKFWEQAALDAMEEIYWFKPWDKPFELDYPSFKWFVGGLTNACYSAVDYNIARGRAGKAAIISEIAETGEARVVTYAQLLHMVKLYAAALRGMGVKKGDRVAIYMPMGIESVASMLACARIGAIHVVIFAGFSFKAVADRIELSGAEYVLAQDVNHRRGVAVELKKVVDDAIAEVPGGQVKKVAVLRKATDSERPMTKGRDIYWEDFLALAEGQSGEVEVMESNEPLFLLPTSGTTAKPKVTVHVHGGYQQYVYSMGQWIYKMTPEDVWFATSDIGWIVGHSYNVYGPLISGCTTLLFEGTPDFPRKDMIWELIERNRVSALWISPTGVRGLMKLGEEEAEKHDLSSIERIFCAGEVLNPAAWEWLQKDVFKDSVPVIDHMWQTETSGPVIGNPYGLGMYPIKPGSAALAVPGVLVDIVDEKTGESCPANEKGMFVIKRPFPGLTPTLWGDTERYKNDYWEYIDTLKGLYCSGDGAYRDEDGYIWFVGRADEVIKISAHRIGTIEIENALISHPLVMECGVSGVPDDFRGEVACAFVVLKAGTEPSEELKKELIQHIRQVMGPIVVMGDIQFVGMLPKTRSGKIMRRVMKKLWLGEDLGDLSTIEDGASVEEIRDAVSRMQATSA